jgi:hypothetical protein
MVDRRRSYGGTAKKNVLVAIKTAEDLLKAEIETLTREFTTTES